MSDPDDSSADTPISISTVEEFNSISIMGGTYELTADLNFNNSDSLLKDKEFSGTFNGNDHTISNITSPLFKKVSGTVNHIIIEGSINEMNAGLLCENITGIVSDMTLGGQVTSYGDGNAGGLCSVSSGTVSRITNNATISGTYDLGGIVGKMTGGTLLTSVNHGSVTSSTHRAGGIAGLMTGGTVGSCENDGNITGRLDAGGIAGSCEGGTINGYVHDCTVKGGSGSTGGISGYIGYMWTISTQKEFVKNVTIIGETRTGGFVGICDGGSALQNIKVTNCTLKTADERKDSADMGGIAGKSNVSIYKCTVSADITVSNNGVCTGGIVGYCYRVNLSDLKFSGSIVSNADNVGGIAGAFDFGEVIVWSGYKYTTSGCTVNADIDVSGNCVGGIIGSVSINISNSSCAKYINNNENSGSVKGKVFVGGIVGRGFCTVVSDITNNMDVEGRRYVGGISGRYSQVNYCTNNGNITATGETGKDTDCGGIGGDTEYTSTHCTNNGTITTPAETNNIGGIFGYTNKGCSYMTNNGTITSKGVNVGGIVGHGWGSISDSVNKANITGKDYVAGIIGLAHGDDYLNYCENSGTITATDGSQNDLFNEERKESFKISDILIIVAAVAIMIGGAIIFFKFFD